MIDSFFFKVLFLSFKILGKFYFLNHFLKYCIIKNLRLNGVFFFLNKFLVAGGTTSKWVLTNGPTCSQNVADRPNRPSIWTQVRPNTTQLSKRSRSTTMTPLTTTTCIIMDTYWSCSRMQTAKVSYHRFKAATLIKRFRLPSSTFTGVDKT
jgi:hypothetical protein